MENIKIIRLDETDSTNRFLQDYSGEEGSVMTIATAEHQTAGRGQGRNTWESEAGRNLLFSIRTRPKALEAGRQFVMLEAGALAILDALSLYADGFAVKWPNDVYWHDMKISGTLSECTVSRGFVGTCILGTGININQQKFTSGAPNPVSLSMITGREVSREDVLNSLVAAFTGYLDKVNSGRYDEIDGRYAASLYRRDGFHAYRDGGGEFMAAIESVAADGRLTLRRPDGSMKTYMFKEVEYII